MIGLLGRTIQPALATCIEWRGKHGPSNNVLVYVLQTVFARCVDTTLCRLCKSAIPPRNR